MGTELVQSTKKTSVVDFLATKYSMDRDAFLSVIQKTIMPSSHTTEELGAFLSVAKEYDLNPITREIYAFPKKGGGVQPIVGIDGWLKLMHSHKDFNGMETIENFGSGGKIVSVTCKIWRKNIAMPIVVTEYLSECSRNTEPWMKWPVRMLRHKATSQAIRYAFGFSGIMDEDEFDRMESVRGSKDVTPKEMPNKSQHIFEELDKREATEVVIDVHETENEPKEEMPIFLIFDEDANDILQFPRDISVFDLLDRLEDSEAARIFFAMNDMVMNRLEDNIASMSKEASQEFSAFLKKWGKK